MSEQQDMQAAMLQAQQSLFRKVDPGTPEASELSRLLARERGRIDVDETGTLRPKTDDQIKKLAHDWWNAGIAPNSCKSPESLAVMLSFGIEAGLTASQCLKSMMIVNNVPAIWGDGALALVLSKRTICHSVDERIDGKGDSAVAVCTTRRFVGSTVQKRETTFSFTQAKHAGLAGKSGPWQQYPKRMLQMRARAFALRDHFADLLMGLSIVEEVRDDAPGVTRNRGAAQNDFDDTLAEIKVRAEVGEPAPMPEPEPEPEPDASPPAADENQSPEPDGGLDDDFFESVPD